MVALILAMRDLQSLVHDIHGEIAAHPEKGRGATYVPQLATVSTLPSPPVLARDVRVLYREARRA